MHGITQDVKGRDIENLQQKADEFIGVVAKLIKEILA
jgi:hypothetical protein